MKSKKTKGGAGSTSPASAGSASDAVRGHQGICVCPPLKTPRYRVTFGQMFKQCQSRRDRECLCRIIKEVCIIHCDFDRAAAYRELQKLHAPRKRQNKGIGLT